MKYSEISVEYWSRLTSHLFIWCKDRFGLRWLGFSAVNTAILQSTTKTTTTTTTTTTTKNGFVGRVVRNGKIISQISIESAEWNCQSDETIGCKQGCQHPASNIQRGTCSIQHPASSIQHPARVHNLSGIFKKPLSPSRRILRPRHFVFRFGFFWIISPTTLGPFYLTKLNSFNHRFPGISD